MICFQFVLAKQPIAGTISPINHFILFQFIFNKYSSISIIFYWKIQITFRKVMPNILITIITLLLLSSHINTTLIFIPGIPVDSLTLLKAQIALTRWQKQLNTNYNTPRQNPYRAKANTDIVSGQLLKIKNQLIAYNNVVLGSNNGLLGSQNIIIGNNNKVLGSSNYVFSSDYNSLNHVISNNGSQTTVGINNSLVGDHWIAELDKQDQIITNMHKVIYPW